MRVEIRAKVTCPWCGLGSHRLNRRCAAAALRKTWNEAHPVTPAPGDAPVCEPDNCVVPARA